MNKIPFRSMPMIVRLASFLSLLLGWITFENAVIEGQGLAPYLPFYRVGAFCTYDAVMLGILFTLWVVLSKKTQ